MGNSLSDPNAATKKSIAFKKEFDLGDILSQCSDDCPVIVITVFSANDLSPGHLLGGMADPIVKLSVAPVLDPVGAQSQRTSRRLRTLDPVWEPPETFQFIVQPSSRIILSAICRHSKKLFLGDGILNISDIAPRRISQIEPGEEEAKSNGYAQDVPISVLLTHPNTGKPSGKINISVSLKTVGEIKAEGTHTVHEFQRYHPTKDWGNTSEHLLPTDPGRFSNRNRTAFFDTCDEAAPIIPEGWVVTSHWSTMGAQIGGKWLYATDFRSKTWTPEKHATSYVRRREWERKIMMVPKSFDDDDHHPAGEESAAAPLPEHGDAAATST